MRSLPIPPNGPRIIPVRTGAAESGVPGVLGVVRTARTSASFFSLKDFEGERAAACEAAGRQLDALGWE